MAHVIVSNIVSLDGYYEGPTHGVMELPMDAAFDAGNRERIESAGTVLLGRSSYEFFGGYWPGIQHQPAVSADDPRSQMLNDDNRAISRRYDDVDILIVSDTLSLNDDSPWRDHTRVIPRKAVADALAAIGGECVMFGSCTTWNGLLKQGLVDELHLMIGARALGGGTPLFAQPADLELRDVHRFDDSDNIRLVYAPRP
jgi:dihydrofolate reductase